MDTTQLSYLELLTIQVQSTALDLILSYAKTLVVLNRVHFDRNKRFA